MKKRLFAYILAGVMTGLILPAPCTADDAGQFYVGRWHFRDADRRPFYIQVKPDQTVASFTASGKSLGKERMGTWQVIEGRLHIAYRSGWTDVLVPRDHRFTKLSYAPGHAFGGHPDALTPAFRLDAQVLAMNTASESDVASVDGAYMVTDSGF